ncbi:MAG: indolepyruvate ferredoxin oxidoreductase subunit alpha [Prochlorococcus sp.]|jgi:NAD-dependent dihydropyrimidine dehydrogenase PreA subunit|nr:ferredoxin family protein [Prochlorococcaceae cyanobacterium ETNP18_MAG_14]HJO77709.1 ferredoxin family protein [Prochlorococcaceae cyanobacterium Fu_MAG_134]|tara:strand:- start:2301 stop:2525 length:225 start_codon:yes stop_codon:yes gene_type:complete
MPHSIVTEICEGVADCAQACPVGCIKQSPTTNSKGNIFFWINFEVCIDCGICLQVCPVEGAVLAEERRDLQRSS